MSDIEKAGHLFQKAGLAFPTIPEALAVKLKEQDKWLFSTRTLRMSPYNLQYYVDENDGVDRIRGIDQFTRLPATEHDANERDWTPGQDYAVLCHSGHGVNSYAIQYYLVYGPLHLFLHLGWGGVYMDADAAASKIAECFSLADQILSAALTEGKFTAGEQLTIVGSDFYGSYWCAPGQRRQKKRARFQGPVEVLAEVLHWLNTSAPNQPLQETGP